MNLRSILKGLKAIFPHLRWERLTKREVLELDLDRFKKWEVLRVSVSNWSDTEEWGYNLCVRQVKKTVAA